MLADIFRLAADTHCEIGSWLPTVGLTPDPPNADFHSWTRLTDRHSTMPHDPFLAGIFPERRAAGRQPFATDTLPEFLPHPAKESVWTTLRRSLAVHLGMDARRARTWSSESICPTSF